MSIPRYLVRRRLPYRLQDSDAVVEGTGVRTVADPRFGPLYAADRVVILAIAAEHARSGEPLRIRPWSLRARWAPAWGVSQWRQRLLAVAHSTLEIARPNCVERIAVASQVDLGDSEIRVWLSSSYIHQLQGPQLDSAVVRELVDDALALDLALWIATEATEASSVAVRGRHGLISQLGCRTRNNRRTRQQLRASWARLIEIWPDCGWMLTPCANQVVRVGQIPQDVEKRQNVVDAASTDRLG